MEIKMAIQRGKRERIEQCVKRLVMKNTSTVQKFTSGISGWFSDNLEKEMVSKVFDFDPHSDVPIERLVFEALFNGLKDEDIEDLFRRYARNKGLDF
jgi:hypothetical protein